MVIICNDKITILLRMKSILSLRKNITLASVLQVMSFASKKSLSFFPIFVYWSKQNFLHSSSSTWLRQNACFIWTFFCYCFCCCRSWDVDFRLSLLSFWSSFWWSGPVCSFHSCLLALIHRTTSSILHFSLIYVCVCLFVPHYVPCNGFIWLWHYSIASVP